MLGNYLQAFSKGTERDNIVPSEIIEILNNRLPKSLEYVQGEDGSLLVAPKIIGKESVADLSIEGEIDAGNDSKLLTTLSNISKEKWFDYIYRSRRIVKVKNVRIGDEEKKIPLASTVGDPFSDEQCEMMYSIIGVTDDYPIMEIGIETDDGEKDTIQLQQQAYDNVIEIKYANVNFKAIKFEIFIYQPLVENVDEYEAETNANNPIKINFSIKPRDAASVEEAVKTLNIFKCVYNNTLKVEDKIIHWKNDSKIDWEKFEEQDDVWRKLLALEKKLNVSFLPNAPVTKDDEVLIGYLYTGIVEERPIAWKHPLVSFHIGDFDNETTKQSFEAMIQNSTNNIKFFETPKKKTIMGAETTICCLTTLNDFSITSVEWDNEDHSGATVFLTDSKEKEWTLLRQYMTESQMHILQQKLEDAEPSEVG